MKANEAPEKIYLSDFTDTTEAVFYVKKDNTKKTDIEYIRTDAFIEKACEFFAPYIPDNSGGYERAAVIGAFKNYMKG